MTAREVIYLILGIVIGVCIMVIIYQNTAPSFVGYLHVSKDKEEPDTFVYDFDILPEHITKVRPGKKISFLVDQQDSEDENS